MPFPGSGAKTPAAQDGTATHAGTVICYTSLCCCCCCLLLLLAACCCLLPAAFLLLGAATKTKKLSVCCVYDVCRCAVYTSSKEHVCMLCRRNG